MEKGNEEVLRQGACHAKLCMSWQLISDNPIGECNHETAMEGQDQVYSWQYHSDNSPEIGLNSIGQ